MGWIGNGSRRTGRWPRPVWGGCHREEPHRPGKAGNQTQHPDAASWLKPTEGPLSIVVAGANVHDTKLLALTLESIVVERPVPTEAEPQRLCLDKGYDNPTGREAVWQHGYETHIRRIGEEKLDARGAKSHQHAGGWWSGPWDGCRNAGRCW